MSKDGQIQASAALGLSQGRQDSESEPSETRSEMPRHKMTLEFQPEQVAEGPAKKYVPSLAVRVPAWLDSLSQERLARVMNVAARLDWELPSAILVGVEECSGAHGLWAVRQTRLDVLTEIRNIGFFEPRNLLELPVDPAEAAMLGCMRKEKNGQGDC